MATSFYDAALLKQENKFLNIMFDQFISFILCSTLKRQFLAQKYQLTCWSAEMFANSKISDSPKTFNPKMSGGLPRL